MNYIISSSRGKGLEDIIINKLRQENLSSFHVQVISTPSAKLSKLKSIALDIIASSPSDDIHIYFIGFFCDLTTIVRSQIQHNGRWSAYQEVVFEEDPEQAVPRLSELLQSTHTDIAKTNATPIICTIPPGNIQKWNTTRLSQTKTCTLKHTDKYPQMQTHLNNSIVEINKIIISLNSSIKAHTPRLADWVLRKKGKNKGYKTFDKALDDGVHASAATKKIWGEMIAEAVIHNRSQSSYRLLITIPNGPDSGSESDREFPNKRQKFHSERC